QKVFENMQRVGKGFLGVETPLFETMLKVRDIAEEVEAQIPAQDDDVQEHAAEEVDNDVVLPTPSSPSPSSPVIPSSPPHQSPSPPQPQAAAGSSYLFQQVLDTCSALVLMVEGFENANVAQQLEIVKLKARVKKLEKLDKVKSSKLRRLRKVGTSQRVESSDDVENVFNQGRISVDMETDEGIELVVDQEKDAEVEGRHTDKQAEIYNIDLDHSLKVLSMQEDDTKVQEAVEVVTTAKLITEVVTAAATQVVAASTPILAAKPKSLKIAAAPAVSTRKIEGVVIIDPEEELHIDTLAETLTMKDKGKGILIEDPKPGCRYIKRYHGIKKKPQSESEARKNMISYLKNTEGYKMEFFKGKTYDQILPIFQARFDANLKFLFKSREEMEKEDEEIIKSINETPSQKAAKRRKLSEEAQEADDLKKRLKIVQDEDDDVFVQSYSTCSEDDTHQFYISFTTLLKNFDREDLETLWRIVKDRFSTKKPTNFSDEYLLLTLKTMFGELDEQDAIWRNQKSIHGLALVKRWKLLTSCGVHVIILSTVQLFLLVERSELHALLSDHGYMLGKTRAPAPFITSSFAANYAVRSPSMQGARHAQLLELIAQLSALGFQVSPIAPSDTRANIHVIPDMEAMDNSEAYYDDDALHVGNGKGLSILHIGSSKSLVPRAFNTNVVDGKWVYRLKQDKNGAITRYKARFVAKGFRQQPGNDDDEMGIKQSSGDIFVKPLHNVINTNVDTYGLPNRNKRHEWLRFNSQGYTKEEQLDFETRLGKIYYRKVHRVQVLDFTRLAEIEDGDMDMTERLRMQPIGADGEVLFSTFV
nr:putative copia-type protein [Tanacetum cinerariifolium]